MKEEKKQESVEKAKFSYQRFLRWVKGMVMFLAIVCFLWISLDGYHRLTSRELIEKSAPLIAPLNPQLNTTVLEEIEKKQFFAVSEVNSVFSSPIEELSEESTPSAESSEGEIHEE